MPVDPHVRRFLDRLAALNPPSALTLSVSERRSALHDLLGFAARSEPVVDVVERTVPGADGILRVRIYTPIEVASPVLPGLIYFHGGGFVAGSLDSHDAIARAMTNASGCRVVAVDYRLAPEHPFPAALADGMAVTRWVADHAVQFGIDPQRLGICGDSAGATLAAVVCQQATATGQARLACQVLLCPIMDFCADTASRREYAHGFFIDQATLDHDLKHYLGPGSDAADPRISPLRATQLAGLPPTCVYTAEFDPLRDEGAAYADRLRLAGVHTTYRCHLGMIHLFYGMGALIPYAATAYRVMGTDIRLMLT